MKRTYSRGGALGFTYRFDKDTARLDGSGSRMIPLLVVPGPDGRGTDRRREGSVKGDGAGAEMRARCSRQGRRTLGNEGGQRLTSTVVENSTTLYGSHVDTRYGTVNERVASSTTTTSTAGTRYAA